MLKSESIVRKRIMFPTFTRDKIAGIFRKPRPFIDPEEIFEEEEMVSLEAEFTEEPEEGEEYSEELEKIDLVGIDLAALIPVTSKEGELGKFPAREGIESYVLSVLSEVAKVNDIVFYREGINEVTAVAEINTNNFYYQVMAQDYKNVSAIGLTPEWFFWEYKGAEIRLSRIPNPEIAFRTKLTGGKSFEIVDVTLYQISATSSLEEASNVFRSGLVALPEGIDRKELASLVSDVFSPFLAGIKKVSAGADRILEAAKR